MIAEIRRLTDQPVRYLAHTHWHADHVMADAEYKDAFPGITILSTGFTRSKIATEPATYKKDVAEKGPAAIERMKQLLATGRRGDGTPLSDEDRRMLEAQARDHATVVSELAGARPVSPDLTFEGNVTVHLGRREVRLRFLGRGNTAGDTVVHVPDARFVATGDLLVHPTPYGHGGYPGDWIATLRKLMAIDAAAIVPGHGPVMRDWSYAWKLIPLLESVRSQARAAAEEGATLEETRQRVRLERFEKEFAGNDPARARAFRSFFVEPIVERAWQEARGAFTEEGTVRPK
jgi:glyoxylase-like metal-dependent hydrolase (beta-lactamase superfamily II)